MLRQLFFSYERQPGVLHSATNPCVAWNNRRWGVEDVHVGLHASFSWVGSGAIVTRQSARRFLRQLAALQHVDLDVCDNMFAYLMNQHPVLMLSHLDSTGLSGRHAFSRGPTILKRLSSARREALIGLREHIEDWFPNRTHVIAIPALAAIHHSGGLCLHQMRRAAYRSVART